MEDAKQGPSISEPKAQHQDLMLEARHNAFLQGSQALFSGWDSNPYLYAGHVLRSVEVGMLQEMYRPVLNSVWLEAVIMEKL